MIEAVNLSGDIELDNSCSSEKYTPTLVYPGIGACNDADDEEKQISEMTVHEDTKDNPPPHASSLSSKFSRVTTSLLNDIQKSVLIFPKNTEYRRATDKNTNSAIKTSNFRVSV